MKAVRCGRDAVGKASFNKKRQGRTENVPRDRIDDFGTDGACPTAGGYGEECPIAIDEAVQGAFHEPSGKDMDGRSARTGWIGTSTMICSPQGADDRLRTERIRS